MCIQFATGTGSATVVAMSYQVKTSDPALKTFWTSMPVMIVASPSRPRRHSSRPLTCPIGPAKSTSSASTVRSRAKSLASQASK